MRSQARSASAILMLALAATSQSPTQVSISGYAISSASCYDESRDRIVSFQSGSIYELQGNVLSQSAVALPAQSSSSSAVAYDPISRTCFLVADQTYAYDGHSLRSVAPGRVLQEVHADTTRGVLIGIHKPSLQVSGPVALEELHGSQWSTVASLNGNYQTCYASFDRARGRLVVVGFQIPPLRHDTYEWDGTTLHGPTSTPPSPALFSPHRLVNDAVGQRTLAFSASGQAYSWNGSSWSRSPSLDLSERADVVLGDARNGRLIAQGQRNRIHENSGSGWTTREVFTPNRLSGQVLHDAGNDRTILVAYEQQTALPGAQMPLFAQWSRGSWSVTQPAPFAPNTISGTRCVVDLARNELVAFGGEILFGIASNLTHVMDLTTGAWRVAASSGPSARTNANLVFDPVRSRVLLVGGLDPNPAVQAPFNQLNDLWAWNGSSWSQVAAAVPTQRTQLHAGFDPVRDRLVVLEHGGNTLEFDGVSWAVTATNGPRPPVDAMLSFDPRRSLLLAMTNNAGLRSMQSYSGSAWAPDSYPYGHYAFDPATGAAIVHNHYGTSVLSTSHASRSSSGAGCGGTVIATSLTGSRPPRQGDDKFRVELQAEAAQQPSLIGMDSTLGAAPLGNGCTLYLANAVGGFFGSTDSYGFRSQSIPIPDSPSLRGIPVHFQGAVLNPASPAGFALTQALTIQVGD